MFLRINNDYAQMLIKIDNIIKIIGRPGPVDNPDIKEEWEVGVFTQDERQLVPGHDDSVWVGNYEVIYRGSESDCQDYLSRLSDQLPSSITAD